MIGRAALLGAVQGVAEVVPVSSSAQLVLLPWLAGWEPAAQRTTFAAGLHAGSCVGTGWALRSELRGLNRRMLVLVAASSVPAAVAGALVADRVEERLGRPPQLAILLAGAGLLMWAVDRLASTASTASRWGSGSPDASTRDRVTTTTVGPRQAALAGLAQVAALVPGISRSGATFTALRAVGVDRTEASRFSRLMSLPITAGAAGLTLARDRAAMRELGPPLAVGVVTAALAGAAATAVTRHRPGSSLAAAALYRLGLSAVVVRRLRQQRRASR